jgi:hypothetical protein
MICRCGTCLGCRRRAAARAARAAYADSPRGRAARSARNERARVERKAQRERARAAARARPASKKRGTRSARIPTLASVPRETRKKLARAWARANPEKRAAHAAVRAAIKAGTLVRGPCEVCGRRRVQAHHDDYAAPLAVRWLCGEHHRAHHAESRLTLAEFVVDVLGLFIGPRAYESLGNAPRGCTSAPPKRARHDGRSAAGGLVKRDGAAAVGPRAHEAPLSQPHPSPRCPSRPAVPLQSTATVRGDALAGRAGGATRAHERRRP